MLLPHPRHLVLGDDPASTSVRYAVDSSLPPEGYRVVATVDGVTVSHADDAGHRYADALLDQLRGERDDGALPCCEVLDYPSLPVRGYMLDVSRDRVPTRETLARIVEILALARFNHFQLYVEHTFAYEGEEEVWGSSSPLDADDLRWLDDICAQVGIELAANQNSFGHMEHWLRHPNHAHRAECPEGSELLPGVPLAPMLLAPNEDNAAFAVRLVREQLACLRSRTVNIGCDETFELGRGVSAEAVAARGKATVYAEHVARIAGPLVDDGFEVLLWGDILRGDPDVARLLPDKSITALAWTYESPESARSRPQIPARFQAVLDSLGADADLGGHTGFAANVAPFVEAGLPFWVCPGTSSWNSLVGRIDNAMGNIFDAAVVGARSGAGGLLLTDWGDNGHLQPPSVSFGPVVYAGAVAWCPETNAEIDVPAVLDGYVFDDAARVLGGAFDRLGRLWGTTGQFCFNSSPLQAALCPSQFHLVFGDAEPGSVEEVVTAIDDVLAELERATPACADGEVIVAELSTAARLARHGAMRMLRAAGGAAPDDASLRAELAGLIAKAETNWLARSRPGGADDSLAHLRRTLATYAP